MDGMGIGVEGRQAPGTEPGWVEAHRVDAWAVDGSLGVTWAFTARPDRQRAGFHAAVLEPGRPPVVLAEDDIELPASQWELRTSGLWADHICETPLEHWSYGLESFALAVEDPTELLGRAVGDRFPLGWELEFEGAGPAEPEGPTAYRQAGEVHGLLLLGRRQVEVELAAVRRHWWGTEPPATLRGRGEAPGPGAVALPEPGGCWWVRLGRDGLEVTHQQR